MQCKMEAVKRNEEREGPKLPRRRWVENGRQLTCLGLGAIVIRIPSSKNGVEVTSETPGYRESSRFDIAVVHSM